MTNEEYLARLREDPRDPEEVLKEKILASIRALPNTCPECDRGVCTVQRTVNPKARVITEVRRCVVCRHSWTKTRPQHPGIAA